MALLAAELGPNGWALAAAVAADVAFGDPVYAAHPVRLIGRTLAGIEHRLRRIGANGYLGGILLFAILAIVWVGGLSGALVLARGISVWCGWFVHVFLVYSLIALADLLHHGWRVERPLQNGDLSEARRAIANLVGRDTDRMDAAACRRAAIESLSENLTDGFASPLFWYALAGIPGLVLFKVVSTMDSMVGYKTPKYRQFGWCGARLDDVMNFAPARLTWLALSCAGSVVPGCSGVKAFRIGLEQHALLPGPNSGWSEAAAAGGLQRRLVGPIWMDGRQVTDVWLGDPEDPPARDHQDFVRASVLIIASGVLALAVTVGLVILP